MKFGQKFVVIPCSAEERFELFEGFWRFDVEQCFHSIVGHGHTVLVDSVTQISDRRQSELRFLDVDFHAVLLQTIENKTQMLLVFSGCLAMDDQIIDISVDKIPRICEQPVDERLKLLARTLQAEAHIVEHVRAAWCSNCCLPAVGFLDGYLIVGSLQVDHREVPAAGKSVVEGREVREGV